MPESSHTGLYKFLGFVLSQSISTSWLLYHTKAGYVHYCYVRITVTDAAYVYLYSFRRMSPTLEKEVRMNVHTYVRTSHTNAVVPLFKDHP